MTCKELSLRIRFRAVRENLARIRSVVETVLRTDPNRAFTPDDVDEILLGVQESLSNVSRHAYDEGRAGTPDVDLVIEVKDGRFRASVEDGGRGFDPSQVPEPDPDAPRDNGYGLFLLDRTMDQVRWERRDGRNLVHLERVGANARTETVAPVEPRAETGEDQPSMDVKSGQEPPDRENSPALRPRPNPERDS